MAAGRWSGWLRSGEPLIWLSAACVTLCLLAVCGLLGLLAARGLGAFWPVPAVEVQYREADGGLHRLAGQVLRRQELPAAWREAAGLTGSHDAGGRILLRLGGVATQTGDYRWLLEARIEERRTPRELMVVEREDGAYLYGYLLGSGGVPDWDGFQRAIERANALQQRIRDLQQRRMVALNRELERLRLAERKSALDAPAVGAAASAGQPDRRTALLQAEHARLQGELEALHGELGQSVFALQMVDGAVRVLPVAHVLRAYRPNAMSARAKCALYAAQLREFLTTGPRSAGAVDGIYPAIFGTVLLVLLMAMLVMPFGVLAAVYLREYARQGWLTGTIRVALHNLAGVPSVVYGLFGLGFFVYSLGGGIDRWLFPEALPAPTFGTPGLFWAALTLALLTLPVVIVATEEGLARLPLSLREASFSLGASRWQTVSRVVLPAASPALITGLILAVARAAGEVAPLMLVGVVKVARDLPVDGSFPYVHLERKFMHLGYHVYNLGFQSAQVEASQSLVYLTALLLVVVVFALNLFAIVLRNRLREKYRVLES